MKRRGNTFGSIRVDVLVFWLAVRGWAHRVDWFDVSTKATAYLCAFSILSSLLAIAIAHGWLDLPQLAALMGLPH